MPKYTIRLGSSVVIPTSREHILHTTDYISAFCQPTQPDKDNNW